MENVQRRSGFDFAALRKSAAGSLVLVACGMAMLTAPATGCDCASCCTCAYACSGVGFSVQGNGTVEMSGGGCVDCETACADVAVDNGCSEDDVSEVQDCSS